ncbi:hypothetical protein [Anaplasma phagocytophilum]|uniref:hypothetical protein n=1 Tax=Anaplasma phagocytophilum TaxID=948 RepID=UPI00200C55DE|nr:hypothetical protein [Anaplasma phagocytophilum]UQD53921.1 hypothetical protein ESP60_00155 [Anaplasma phagocytophilum]
MPSHRRRDIYRWNRIFEEKHKGYDKDKVILGCMVFMATILCLVSLVQIMQGLSGESTIFCYLRYAGALPCLVIIPLLCVYCYKYVTKVEGIKKEDIRLLECLAEGEEAESPSYDTNGVSGDREEESSVGEISAVREKCTGLDAVGRGCPSTLLDMTSGGVEIVCQQDKASLRVAI